MATPAAAALSSTWRPAMIQLLEQSLAAYNAATTATDLSPHSKVSLGYQMMRRVVQGIEAARDADWVSVEGPHEPFPAPSSPIAYALPLSPPSPPLSPILLPLQSSRKRHKRMASD
jgi:hypothetical protein